MSREEENPCPKCTCAKVSVQMVKGYKASIANKLVELGINQADSIFLVCQDQEILQTVAFIWTHFGSPIVVVGDPNGPKLMEWMDTFSG